MQFSMVDGVRRKPFPKGKGTCPLSKTATQAKCGRKLTWHWSHISTKNCDPWWEQESDWHREWKSHWPEEQQEVIHFDETTGEKHISDVKNDNNLVIEFQNSPISIDELEAREAFYGNMIWIINTDKFKHNIQIGAKLPNPNLDAAQDMCIFPTKGATQEFIYWKNSEKTTKDILVEVHSSHKIQSFIDDSHVGHYTFFWKRPRMVWLESNKPVLLDFGNEFLWHLATFNQCSPRCLRAYCKKYLINEYGGTITSNLR